MRPNLIEHHPNHFTIRDARPEDLPSARAVILRVLDQDVGTGYVAKWHWDLDDLQGTYLDHPRHAFFVAVDDSTQQVIGTTGVRSGAPKSPPFPKWLTDRYDPGTTAQLYRVYVAREHRRRGVACALVNLARTFIANEGGYRVIYFHTQARVVGAEPFWRSMPTTLIYDERTNENSTSDTVHFEIAVSDPKNKLNPGG